MNGTKSVPHSSPLVPHIVFAVVLLDALIQPAPDESNTDIAQPDADTPAPQPATIGLPRLRDLLLGRQSSDPGGAGKNAHVPLSSLLVVTNRRVPSVALSPSHAQDSLCTGGGGRWLATLRYPGP